MQHTHLPVAAISLQLFSEAHARSFDRTKRKQDRANAQQVGALVGRSVSDPWREPSVATWEAAWMGSPFLPASYWHMLPFVHANSFLTAVDGILKALTRLPARLA
jgi:hypothetical protein